MTDEAPPASTEAKSVAGRLSRPDFLLRLVVLATVLVVLATVVVTAVQSVLVPRGL